MGEYFYIANKTRREFLHPHKLGEGLKRFELGSNCMHALAWLLCGYKEAERGGSWCGDSIVIIGDYDQKSDPTQETIEKEYTDITYSVVEELCRATQWFARGLAKNQWFMGNVRLPPDCGDDMPQSLRRMLIEVSLSGVGP